MLCSAHLALALTVAPTAHVGQKVVIITKGIQGTLLYRGAIFGLPKGTWYGVLLEGDAVAHAKNQGDFHVSF